MSEWNRRVKISHSALLYNTVAFWSTVTACVVIGCPLFELIVWKWPFFPGLSTPSGIVLKQSFAPRSCKSGRAFRVGFGPGMGLKLTKISGLIRAWDVLFVLGVQRNNQNKLATLLNFLDLTQVSFFFRHDLGFKLIFGFGLRVSGSGRVRAWTCRPVYNSAAPCSHTQEFRQL